ncbi:MAG: class I SAM-dependent methyltransferase [Archaeoglobaceae archaeon]
MECKTKIKHYWDCNVEVHDKFFSFFQDEELIWREFLIGKLGDCQKILEMGCGTGNLTKILVKAGYHVTAVDISPQMLRKFASNNGCQILLGDAENPPFKEDSFDAVICRNLMCTLPEPEKTLHNWSKLLKQGGKLCIIDKIDTGTNIRERIGHFLVLMLEGQNLWRLGYGKDTASLIPFHCGFKPHALKSLVSKCGFEKVIIDRMDAVNIAKRRNVPFYYNLLREENFCVTAQKS